MCDSPQQLKLLASIENKLITLCNERQAIDSTVYISATQPYFLDNKNRLHVYVYSDSAITLVVGSIATISLTAHSWAELPFPQSTPVYAQAQTSLVPLFVRCTDALMVWEGASPSGPASNVNVTDIGGDPVSLGQSTMASSVPVTIASNQSAVPITGSISATNPSVSGTGSAVPADATYIAGSNGGTLQALAVDSAGRPTVNINGTPAVSISGTPTVAQGSPPWAQNVTQVAGTPIAPGSAALPILDSAAAGYVAAYGSNPANTGTANTDVAFKWGASGTTQVNHIMIQNNTASTVVLFDLDVATTSGSPTIAGGQTFFFDVQCSAVHLQSATANVPINAANGIVIRGWL